MSMVSLKLAKKKPDDSKMPETIEPSDSETYPYGSTLRFESEQIAKIPALQEVNAGDIVTIHAVAKIREVRSVDKEGPDDKRQSIEIQVQKIEVMRESGEEYSAGFDKATSKA